MAITIGLALVVAANKTAEASTTSTAVIETCDVGDLVIVGIAADNAGTAGAAAVSSVTDSTGANTYTQVKLENRTSGAANDGCTAALYQSVLITALTINVDTITVNWSPNVTAKGFAAVRVQGADTTAYATDNASGSGTTYTSNASASMASGDLYVGMVANESNTAPVIDSDTTNGSWVSISAPNSGGTGGDGTKMSGMFCRKLVTGAGTQTLNAATGANTDWALVAALYTVAGPAAERVPYYQPYPPLLAQ